MKLFVSFVAGALVAGTTSIAVLSRNSTTIVALQANQPTVPQQPVSQQIDKTDQSRDAEVSREAARADGPAELATLIDISLPVQELTDEEIAILSEQLRAYNAAVRSEELRRRSIAKWADEPPPGQPITLPREFDWLRENPVESHELVQREQFDPSWSPMAEDQLRNYFLERPELTARFGYPIVTCRSTLCEVAFTYQESSPVPPPVPGVPIAPGERMAAQQRFNFDMALPDFPEGPLADQFADASPMLDTAANFQDGVVTLLWFLERKVSPQPISEGRLRELLEEWSGATD